jgi:DNA ligase-1
VILDGEAIALHADGRSRPFQDTMARLGRTSGRGKSAREARDSQAAPLSLAVFDALLVDDETLLAQPTSARIAAMTALGIAPSTAGGARIDPAEARGALLALPRLVTADAGDAAAFYADAIARGHEGVMAKALGAPYEAGSRGSAWLKIKKVHRLDLIVIAAEWGSGRRRGWLSNLWMGARDPSGAEPVMLGKTFKGMHDTTLAWQTRELLAREIDRTTPPFGGAGGGARPTGDRDGHVVHVRPELVAEFAFNDVQRSSRYPGGVALRLARLVRYRADKTAAEADTIDTVRAIAIADGVLPAR